MVLNNVNNVALEENQSGGAYKQEDGVSDDADHRMKKKACLPACRFCYHAQDPKPESVSWSISWSWRTMGGLGLFSAVESGSQLATRHHLEFNVGRFYDR
jgi:hypothetical protein